MTQEEALRAYEKRLAEHHEFCQLVKRMREAQVKSFEVYTDDEWWADRAIELEKEVDEYLEKMEE